MLRVDNESSRAIISNTLEQSEQIPLNLFQPKIRSQQILAATNRPKDAVSMLVKSLTKLAMEGILRIQVLG